MQEDELAQYNNNTLGSDRVLHINSQKFPRAFVNHHLAF
jgi:hypothetical protein